ncbi:TraB/GumN family protein [Chitinophaga sp. RAB17]|uniref:TraB/GumN family protein n=1 Tax=Chitinophaga sp. RAB17 TaxID=3233049 RepID=UPI003F938398
MESVFWKVYYPGTGVVSYILGTSHPFFGKEWLEKYPAVVAGLDSSELFYAEQLLNDSAAATLSYGSGEVKPPRPLEYWFGKDNSMIDSFCQKTLEFERRPSEILMSVRSEGEQRTIAAVINFLTLNKIIAAIGFRPTYGKYLDRILTDSAKQLGKDLHALDEISYIQKEVYDKNVMGTDIATHIRWLGEAEKQMITSSELQDIKDFATNYEKGVFDYTTSANPAKYSDATKAVSRNHQWIKTLESTMKQRRCFIAVGISHLILRKNDGIITMLRKRGFRVEPVLLQ